MGERTYNRMKFLAPILHAKWKAGEDPKEIIHTWAEDGTEEAFTVPYQMRDRIIEMQNWLADKYMKVDRLDRSMRRITNFFEEDHDE